MKEVHVASTVENISLKSARAILSTVVNEYSDNPDHIFSNEAGEKKSEKYSLRTERRIAHKRVSRKGPLLYKKLNFCRKYPILGQKYPVFFKKTNSWRKTLFLPKNTKFLKKITSSCQKYPIFGKNYPVFFKKTPFVPKCI